MANSIKIDLFHFVEKGFVYIVTHWKGHKAESQATAEFEAYKPKLAALITNALGTKAGQIFANGVTITQAEFAAALAPEYGAVVTAAADALPLPANLRQTGITWAQDQETSVIGDVFQSFAKHFAGAAAKA